MEVVGCGECLIMEDLDGRESISDTPTAQQGKARAFAAGCLVVEYRRWADIMND
jgi:hypothetical protein